MTVFRREGHPSRGASPEAAAPCRIARAGVLWIVPSCIRRSRCPSVSFGFVVYPTGCIAAQMKPTSSRATAATALVGGLQLASVSLW